MKILVEVRMEADRVIVTSHLNGQPSVFFEREAGKDRNDHEITAYHGLTPIRALACVMAKDAVEAAFLKNQRDEHVNRVQAHPQEPQVRDRPPTDGA